MSLNNIVHQDEFLRNTLINLLANKGNNNFEDFSLEILRTTFETLLQAEREAFFKDKDRRDNKKNGYYSRLVKTLSGVFEMNIPRDRIGQFKPLVLQIAKQEKRSLDKLALSLYTKGLSTRDINKILKDAYGLKTSPQYISNISSSYLELKKTWDNRKLDSKYYAVYIDALHMNIRRSSSVDNEALYVAVGLKLDLTREILGIYSIPEESASGWKEVVQDLKKRGMKQAISFVADGLKGLDSVIREEYPNSLFQRCIVHLKRSIGYRIRPADRAEIMIDLKMVFNLDDVLDTKELAMERLQLFINKWKKRYVFIGKMDINEHHFTYLLLPFEIRRMIYTTNWIERLNKEFRKVIKNKNSFPNEESALMLVWLKAVEIEDNLYKYPISSLNGIKEKLNSMLK